MASISDLIKKRKEVKTIELDKAKIVDINKPLTLALFGIDVFGKEATDDSILEIIIGGSNTKLRAFEKHWDQMKATAKNFKKGKDGHYYADGLRVLRPRTRA